MNDRQYYHAALESAFLDSVTLKNKINSRIATLHKRRENHIRLPKRLIIALVAAAILLLASVTYAAVLIRNKAFKDYTNGEIENTIREVEEPLSDDNHEGWQPYNLILSDDVMSTKADVLCPVSNGTMQLSELHYGARLLYASFAYHTDEGNPCEVTDLAVQWNDEQCRSASTVNLFDTYTIDHYCGNAAFTAGSNPLLPNTTFVFTGKVNGDEFTLTYMLTEETFELLRKQSVESLKEHEDLVNRIPNEGTLVGYTYEGVTLTEVAVADNRMYFTVVSNGVSNAERELPPYSKYDSGFYPVIDGRICDEYYLGVPEGKNPDGTVYCAYLPYTPETAPTESLITYNGAAFRYEWKTGKVTLPKDRAEYEAWRKESMDQCMPYCEADWVWRFREQIGDAFVTDLVFHTHTMYGVIGIAFESEHGFGSDAELPKVMLNGIELKHVGEVDPLTGTAPGMRGDGKKCGFCMVGCSPADLGDTFVLTVTWHGETTSVTLRMSDVNRCNAEKVRDYGALFDY